MAEILFLAVWVALGYWCTTIAKSKNRSEGLAFVIGIVFGIFAVIGYAMLGERKTKKTR